MKVITGKTNSRMACVRITFDAGANVEFGKWTSGIAHLLEHSVFISLKDMSPEEFNKRMGTLGANVNAGTYQDRICLYFTCPAENVIEASKLLKKVVYDGAFNNELFEKEKLVVLEEERDGRDSIDDCVGEELNKFLCVGPYAVPIIGTEESIKSITLDEVKKFHKYYYRPERALLTITGPESMDFDAVVEVFGENDDKCKKSKKVLTKYTDGKEKTIRDKRIQQARAFVCYKGSKIGEDDALVLSFMSKFFSEGMDSRLFQKIRQEKGLCYGCGGYNYLFKELGWYNLYIMASEKNIKESLEIMEQEVNLVKTEEPTDEEMIRARNKYRADIYGIIESSAGLCSILNGRAFYGMNDINVSLERVSNITKEDVMRVCKKYFKDEGKQTFLYLPDGGEINEDV